MPNLPNMIPNNFEPFTLSYGDFVNWLNRLEEYAGEFYVERTLEVFQWFKEEGCTLVYINSDLTMRDMHFIYCCKNNLRERAGDIQIYCGTQLTDYSIVINN